MEFADEKDNNMGYSKISTEPIEDSSTKYLLKRLFSDYVVKHKYIILLAVFCMIIAAVSAAANAWMLQPALDEIFINKDKQMLKIIPLAIIAIAIVNAAASYIQTILMRKVGQRLIADVQIDMFKHLLNADINLFHDFTSGKIISRFTNDIQLMRIAVSSFLTGIAKEFLTMIFLIGVMIYQSWQLSLIALVVFPVAIYPIIRLGKNMRKVSHGTQQELGQFATQLDEIFSSVRIVKAYNKENFEIKRAINTVTKLYKFYMKSSKIQAAASPIMEMLGGLAIAGVIFYGGMQVIDGETTTGAFFSFIAAMMMAYKPVRSVANINTQMQEGLAATRRIYDVLDTEPTIKESANATPLIIKSGAEIKFNQVEFSYDDSKEIIASANITIPAGKMVALVGASGGGKSTIMNLLMRFYDATNGEITIDNQNLRDVTLNSLRENIAFVSQEVLLFDDTVRANIAYGKENATDAEIENAAKHAAAHEFIKDLPNGYDTIIGPSGAKISGGQRQRISIARAMLKDAPILLLDEATSALDTSSEKLVQKALDELTQHRTTLVIAHRLSTIQNADIIYVMDKGQIIEYGSHSELLANNGEYTKLYNLQFADKV